MKKFKFSMIAVIALIMGIAGSAFTAQNADLKKDTVSSFYRYTSSSTTQTEIQKISNYVSSNIDCPGSDHVCGVYLSTSRTLGQPPVTSEFNAEQSDLWDSENGGFSVDPDVIKMKN